jgi:superfamily I DNA/RNA helicase
VMDAAGFVPNPGQARAIAAPLETPVRVVAGAGTGKTEVIARRYLHLLEAGLRPDQVLVLTFSEKAAAEMRARILQAVAAREGAARERLSLAAAPISTFHSFCARLLADHSLRAGLGPGLPLLTELEAADLLDAEQEAFLAEGYRAAYGDFDPLSVPDYDWRAGGPFGPAVAVIEQLRNQALPWQEFRRLYAGVSAPAGDGDGSGRAARRRVIAPLVAWLYAGYAEALARRGQLDFDRLIMEAAALLETHADLRAAWHAGCRAILVDEYQDTNAAQERLLRVLAPPGGSLSVVGDPRQAIYVWREARVENIARFPGDGRARFEAPLTENRRSLSPILAVANRAIRGYAFAAPPEFDAADVLRPYPPHVSAEPAVVLHALPDRAAEAQAVVDWVRRAHAEGLAYGDMALLIRARTYLPVYLAALQAARIPFQASAGDLFYTRPEVLDAVHLLHVCLDPGDDLSLARVLVSPAAGLTQAEVAALLGAGERRLWPAVQAAAAADVRLQRLADFWRQAQAQRLRLMPDAFVGWALRASGLARAGREAPGALHKLMAVAHTFAEQNPRLGLADLAAHLRRLLASNERLKAPELDALADAVQVMTVHAAKGLEFPLVLAVDSREKLTPRRDFGPFHDPDFGLVLPVRDVDDQHPAFVERVRRSRNEARCLWYVTLTRAKRKLVVTAANDAPLEDGRYARVSTLFEELWNSLADEPEAGVALVPGVA